VGSAQPPERGAQGQSSNPRSGEHGERRDRAQTPGAGSTGSTGTELEPPERGARGAQGQSLNPPEWGAQGAWGQSSNPQSGERRERREHREHRDRAQTPGVGSAGSTGTELKPLEWGAQGQSSNPWSGERGDSAPTGICCSGIFSPGLTCWRGLGAQARGPDFGCNLCRFLLESAVWAAPRRFACRSTLYPAAHRSGARGARSEHPRAERKLSVRLAASSRERRGVLGKHV